MVPGGGSLVGKVKGVVRALVNCRWCSQLCVTCVVIDECKACIARLIFREKLGIWNFVGNL
jgi:hypothetical protein